MSRNLVLIIDFGSQYTQLIARRIRQLRVFCEVVPHTATQADVRRHDPRALILSGGPSSVYDPGAPTLDPAVLDMPLPMLAICYGQQLLAHCLGGEVSAASHREYGRTRVHSQAPLTGPGALLLQGFSPDEPFEVWMSHGDHIRTLPPGFVAIAATRTTPFAAIAHAEKPIVGLQFHPEVTHTPRGIEILEAFVFKLAGAAPDWTMEAFLAGQTAAVQKRVKKGEQVICGLSGGVDSSVVAALLARALGERVHCIFVDNGLLRRGEVAQVEELFAHALAIDLRVVDARGQFLRALAGVTDPEQKRKAIGSTFIDVFEAHAQRIDGAHYLAQGTLYPDVIESISATGAGHIKSHHNVGGLPERMRLQLIEPLRALFKDEVRALGAELGLPHHLCWRQPFPGPGLAVRIVGEVTEPRLELLRHADAVVQEEIACAGLQERLWQSFAVLLPVQSVGVMGDARTYEQTIVVRAVESCDGMTADWARLPYEVLGRLSNRIINEVRGVNRVVYDISSKPPSTIEWE